MGSWVYIAECADSSLYTGSASNVDDRIAKHNSGKGAKYTRSRLPVRAVFRMEMPDYRSALSLEYHIKKLSRSDKIKLIALADSGASHDDLITFIFEHSKISRNGSDI